MKKVITYGTFDLFHQGHYNILKRAKELGDYLIVGVTGESYDLDRGKLNVKDSLVQRIKNVRNTGFADEIIVEEYEGQKIQDVQRYGVDILVVGSDWIGKFDYLNKYCRVVYLERTKDISSTQLRESKMIHKVGMIEDTLYCNTVVTESKYVSGMHVEGVFSESLQIAKNFCERYELNFCTDCYQEFLHRVSVVWCQIEKADTETVYYYLKTAIQNKKHVVCNLSHILDPEKIRELYQLATENSVFMLDAVILNYVRLFDQMIWKLKGGTIGDVLSVTASVSAEKYEGGNISEIIYLLLFLMYRTLGSPTENINCRIQKDNGYVSIYAITEIGEFHAAISNGYNIKNYVEIVGTRGCMSIPGEWWNMQYFQIEPYEGGISRYALNFEGSGLRYIYKHLGRLMDHDFASPSDAQIEENVQIIRLLSQLNAKDGYLQQPERDAALLD